MTASNAPQRRLLAGVVVFDRRVGEAISGATRCRSMLVLMAVARVAIPFLISGWLMVAVVEEVDFTVPTFERSRGRSLHVRPLGRG